MSYADNPRPAMRGMDEIQRAHDILTQVLVDPLIRQKIAPFHRMDELLMESAANVLCWVLNHNHSEAFARNLADLEAELKAAGCRLDLLDRPQTLEELLGGRPQ